MAENTQAESGFKVVDRRTFTVDGARREDADVREETEEAKRPAAPSSQDDRLDEGFAMLVEFLANSALLHLGVVGAPGGQAVPVDLESARTMIDLLSAVEDKTKGNLSAVERKFLGDALYELHTRFVETQKCAAAKRK